MTATTTPRRTRCATPSRTTTSTTRRPPARGRAGGATRGGAVTGAKRSRSNASSSAVNRRIARGRSASSTTTTTTRRNTTASRTRPTRARATPTRRGHTTSPRSRRSSSTHEPSDDAVRVCVYRLVLPMSAEQRATLGVRTLRTQVEQSLGLEEGGLKERREVIAATAADCVRAVVDAERRVMEALPEGVMDEDTRASMMQRMWMNRAEMADEEANEEESSNAETESANEATEDVSPREEAGHDGETEHVCENNEDNMHDAHTRMPHSVEQTGTEATQPTMPAEMEEGEEVSYSTYNGDGGVSPGRMHMMNDRMDTMYDETEGHDMNSGSPSRMHQYTDAHHDSIRDITRSPPMHPSQRASERHAAASSSPMEHESEDVHHTGGVGYEAMHTGSVPPMTSTPPPSQTHLSLSRHVSLSPVVSQTNETPSRSRSVTPPHPINRRSCSPRLGPSESVPEQNPYIAYSAYPAC